MDRRMDGRTDEGKADGRRRLEGWMNETDGRIYARIDAPRIPALTRRKRETAIKKKSDIIPTKI